MLLEISIRV